MITAVDVCYANKDIAIAAAVVFRNYIDNRFIATYSAKVNQFGEYIPGQFYKRELPCLMAVLKKVNEKLDTVIIDGYVMLGDKPGLGYYLWEKLGEKVSVIGVAKTLFAGAYSVKIFRGKSNKPLYITSIDIDPISAAKNISKMHGSYRIPKLLKLVDNLANEGNKK
jgi:deoxyribonuclease V